MLSPLETADYVLNACGRPLPPAGYRWVDLPRYISFYLPIAAGVNTVQRVLNKSPQPFLCRAVYVNTGGQVAVRIKWPDGRFLHKNVAASNPHSQGVAAAEMLAVMPEKLIPPSGAISVELSAIGTPGFQVAITFVGCLRFLLKASGSEPDQYIPQLSTAPRVRRYSNILAPEWYLGEQCTPETPAGYEDESFTLLADPVTVNVDPDSLFSDQAGVMRVPGDADFVPRLARFTTTFTGGATGTPTLGVRFDDGYSLTGGDLVPLSTLLLDWNAIFPTQVLRAGTRVFVDMGVIDSASGPGTCVGVLEFDGVKRRKL